MISSININKTMNYKEYFKANTVRLSNRELIAVKLGGLITAARLHAHLSQADLAREIGTQQPSLARAEKGEVVPSIEFLYKIAKAIKTEFIFPKFGFMENKERTSYNVHVLSPYVYTPSNGIVLRRSEKISASTKYSESIN